LSSATTDNARRAEPVAIVGMTGRFPGAVSIEAFWANLAGAVESIHFFTREEYEAAGQSTAAFDLPGFVPARGVLDEADCFDAGLFGYSPREAELLDPQGRAFLECAWEALERAGCDPKRFAGQIGVYGGQGLDTYMFNIMTRPELLAMAGGISALMGVGVGSDYLPMRVSYKLDLHGPSVNVQTGCSTSLVAVHAACQGLMSHDCDLALAGGVTVFGSRIGGYMYEEGGINSPDGHVRVFDAGAGGTVFSEGVGIIALKRLADAVAAGDRIHAVILGSAVNNDGFDKASFTSPSAEAQAALVAKAYATAGIMPDSVSYIELHGTATVVGDPVEASALFEVFKDVPRHRCALGSAKSNVGHLDHAAGAVGIIKTVMALEHRQLPAMVHFDRANPAIDLENGPFYVNRELVAWPAAGGAPRRAGVSAFGIGGTNAHVVLEEAPAPGEPDGRVRSWQLLPLSAASDRALRDLAGRFAEHLASDIPAADLADAAHTLQVGRRQLERRLAVVCHDAGEARAALDGSKPSHVLSGRAGREGAAPVVFMFSGQGTQYAGMAAGLYRSEAVFASTVDLCAERLVEHLGLDIRTLLFPAPGNEPHAAEQLNDTAITQPALFTLEYALAGLWMAWGVRPAAMIGHSIGEIVAACVSGALTLDDALALVGRRGRLMSEAPTGVMLSVALDEASLRHYLDRDLWLAAVNAARACVVSGTHEAVSALESRLGQDGVQAQRLVTSHAFHSGLMECAMAPLEVAAEQLVPGSMGIPYVSNVDGEWMEGERLGDAGYWARQMREPVRFDKGLRTVIASVGPCRLLEIGPGQVLGQLARMSLGAAAETQSIASLPGPRREMDDDEFIHRALARLWVDGVDVDWDGFARDVRRRKAVLPTYPFERKVFWIAPGRREQARSTGIDKRADPGQWLYQPYWRACGPPRRAAGEPVAARWLLLADPHGVCDALASHLRARGADVVMVGMAGSPSPVDDGRRELSPGRIDDFQRLAGMLRDRGWMPEVVVHGFALGAISPGSTDEQRVDLDRGFFSLLYLVQALEPVIGGQQVRLEVLTDGVQPVSMNESCSPARATVTGLCRTIPQEMLAFSCRQVDLDLPVGERARATQIEAVVDELVAQPDEVNIAYRRGVRWCERFGQIDVGRPEAGEIPLREGGLYLVTGGLGNLGLTIATALVDRCRAKLLLIGRAGLPDREQWDDPGAVWRGDARVAARVRLMQDFERRGGEVMARAVDVTDADALARAVGEAERRWGPLCGVFHAAGVMRGGAFAPVQGLSSADVEAMFAPKLAGSLALADMLAARSADFCVLISSLSVVLGGLGNGAYAAANAALDALAASRNAAGDTTRWLCLDFDQWDFGGQADAGSALARLAMTPGEGIDALMRALSLRGVERVVVSTADIDARLAQWVYHGVDDGAEDQVNEGARYDRPDLDTAYIAPRNDDEVRIAGLWSSLLAVERVGVHDNFLDLGGHSLLAAQLLARLRSTFEVQLSLDDVFRHATVAEQAVLVAERRGGTGQREALESKLKARISQMSDAERRALLETARRDKGQAS
jgi:acyl transferase domain-containing protein